MTIISNLQIYYDIATMTRRNEQTSLTKMAISSTILGYISGCIVKWIRPSVPISPLGVAASTLCTLPIAFGCGFILWKVACVFHQSLNTTYFAVGGYLVGGSMWIVFGSLTFTARPLLSPAILTISFAVTLVADFIFGK